MAQMMPLPAHPTPGSGPPDSTQEMPWYPVRTTPSNVAPTSALRDWLRTCSSTVSWNSSPVRSDVQSAFGSQPTTRSLLPSSAKAAATFWLVVDFPMPPLP